MPSLATANEFSISSFSSVEPHLPVFVSITPTVPFWRPTNQMRPLLSGRAEGMRSSGWRHEVGSSERTCLNCGSAPLSSTATTRICRLLAASTTRFLLSR